MNQAEKFKRLDELLGAVKAQPNVNSFADRLRGCMSAEPDTVASLVREMSMMSRAERIVVRTLFNEPGVTLDQTLWFHRHFDRLVLDAFGTAPGKESIGRNIDIDSILTEGVERVKNEAQRA